MHDAARAMDARKGIFMSGTSFLPRFFLSCALAVVVAGCAGRPRGWGLSGQQGTIDRQKSRAVVHDPYPLNDIGPEVVGGRPREYFTPQTEPVRQHAVDQFPQSFGFPQ